MPKRAKVCATRAQKTYGYDWPRLTVSIPIYYMGMLYNITIFPSVMHAVAIHAREANDGTDCCYIYIVVAIVASSGEKLATTFAFESSLFPSFQVNFQFLLFYKFKLKTRKCKFLFLYDKIHTK